MEKELKQRPRCVCGGGGGGAAWPAFLYKVQLQGQAPPTLGSVSGGDALTDQSPAEFPFSQLTLVYVKLFCFFFFKSTTKDPIKLSLILLEAVLHLILTQNPGISSIIIII